jgi:putative hydrolase of the HAD superfamily
MLRAVTLDFWNTLFVDVRGREREQRRVQILREELEALGHSLPPSAYDEALRFGFDFFERVWHDEVRTPSGSEILDAVLGSLRARVPDEVHDRLTTAFERILLDIPPEPVPGLIYTLPALAERYRLAVVCDTGYSPGTVLRELLDRHCALEPFAYLYFSNEHGMSKPDVRVFKHTLAQIRVPAGEAAHVGDMQRTDIAGAQAAGMAAVHFVGANSRDAARSTADAVVRHFEDLPAALGGLTCAGC